MSPPLSCFASRIAELFPLRRKAALLCVCALSVLATAQAQEVAKSIAERHAAFVAQRPAAQGTAAAALQRAKAQQQTSQFSPRTSNFTAPWAALGPSSVISSTFGNLTGRVTAVAVDPNDATGNTVYLGTTGGGVWKSTNAAAAAGSVKFAPLTDALSVFSQGTGSTVIPSLSIGAVAVQPTSPGVILAGTGDPNDASDSLYGEGLLRSADGGATWTLATNSQDGANGVHYFLGLSTAGFAWSTASPQLVVAAMSTSPESAVVNALGASSIAGLYYSTDAGVTWKMATLYDGATVVQAPQITGSGGASNAATAVVWDALRGSFYAAIRGHGYYSSKDGAAWTRLVAQPGSALTVVNCPATSAAVGCPIFRGALAVQAATGDLYALTVDASNQDQGVWQDLCVATSGACSNSAPEWATRLDGGSLEVGSGSSVITQGDYNLALSATPSMTGTLLLAGTIDLWRCTLASGTSSCTWRDTTNALNGCNAPAGVAPSQHAVTALAISGTPLVFLGNDGGLWRSTDGVAETGSVCSATDKTHFDNLNAAIGIGGSLAELVGLAQSPTDTNVLLAGLGALGSSSTTTASSLTAWTQLSTGEGGLAAIDQTTPTNWYASIGAGVNVKQCALGNSCTASSFTGSATIGEVQVAYDTTVLDAPWLLDPAMPTNLIAATCRVWRGAASSSAAWSTSNAISTAFGGGTTPCSSTSPLVRSVAAGGPSTASSNAQNAGSAVIYAGLAGALDGGTAALGGHLFMTAAAGTATNLTAWTDVARNPVTNDSAGFNPGGFDVSGLAVDTHDASGATVYATVQGFASALVYRSVDFGAHWLNITANLPQAPANAVAVDPNDANTIYVATDVGVYATQAVSTCATASCWTLLGTGLPNSPAVTLAVGVALPTGDNRTGMLRVGTYGRGIWQTPLLAALSPTSAALTLSSTSLTFASQQVSTTSVAQTVTITSTGTAALTLSTLALTGDFTETDTCAGKTVAISSTCTVSVVFAPSTVGARTGTLTIYGNISGGQATVTLSGTGVAAPSVVLTPTSLTFSSTIVNQSASAQTISIANTGGSAATISSITSSGDFAITANTCGSSLAPQTACAVSITFTPTASGTRTGTLSVVDSAGTQTATLSGTGSSPATDTLSPTSLTFGTQTLSTTSVAQTVTLTNAGDTALTGISASTGSSEFSATNGCGATLAAHASCAISIVFAPSAVGARSAVLTVIDQFRSQTVALSGTGVAPAGVSLTPSSIAFGAVGVGLTSAVQTVTLTNNGGVALTVSNVAVTGDYVLASSTCGTVLAVGEACALQVVFRPTAAGARTGAITVTDSAPSGTQSVPLTGTGVDFTFAANGATSQTITGAGGSATYALLLSSLSSVTSTTALSCSGAPSHATCVVTPSSVSLGSSINVSVVIATGVAGVALRETHDKLPWSLPIILTACALPFVRRRRRGVSLLALVLLAGCGDGRTIPSTSSSTNTTPATPSGTYSLSVSATAAGVKHIVPLTLVIQ